MQKQITKKYGEWIVKANTNPKTQLTNTIPITSIQDLSKISEELGKPIIQFSDENEKKPIHIYYIIDDTTIYKYTLNSEDKI